MSSPVEPSKRQLSVGQKLSYSVGHVLNDLTASMWFTYMIIYFHQVKNFNNALAGDLVLIGQISDAIFTPFIGYESDRVKGCFNMGKRKTWHFIGTLCVVCSFPFLFVGCITCDNAPDWSQFIYYAPFVVVFQFGWASTQINHLSLIPDLTDCPQERVGLNGSRYAFTVLSNMVVYGIAWVLFVVGQDDDESGKLTEEDSPKFRMLVLIVVGIGILFCFIFHIGVREKRHSRSDSVTSGPLTESSALITIERSTLCRLKMTWKCWLKEYQFYQIALIYMSTRLVVNISQVYLPMYLTETIKLDKDSIAIIPLTVYVSGFVTSLLMKYINAAVGRKVTYLIGVVFSVGTSAAFYYLPQESKLVYGAAILSGIGGSTMLVTSLAMTADLIGDNTGTFLILGGFTLNVFVSSALFRPIELHRKLASVDRKIKNTEGKNKVIFRSLEQVESGAVLSSSTMSVNQYYKSGDVINSSTTTSASQRNADSASHSEEKHITSGETSNILLNSNKVNRENRMKETAAIKESYNKTSTCIVSDHTSVEEIEEHDEDETLLHICDNDIDNSNANDGENKDIATSKLCCLSSKCRKREARTCSRCCNDKAGCTAEAANSVGKKGAKTKLISWSILKNTRFLCYVFATFCFTLPSSALFLPALAKTRGLTEFQAATLLSTGAGFDTLFRVLSGIILDHKLFRSIRPQIYNGVALIQGIMVALFPLMASYADFITLSAVEGAVQGIKNAQGSVIMMDMLGVDKLASSMAVTMSVQCVAVLLGPTISGQLIDSYGSYDEAFYLASGSILLGGAVMAVGNIAKHCRDRRKRFQEKMTLKQSRD